MCKFTSVGFCEHDHKCFYAHTGVNMLSIDFIIHMYRYLRHYKTHMHVLCVYQGKDLVSRLKRIRVGGTSDFF